MAIRSAKDAIREARKNAGLTQEQLAEGICSLQALSRIETGAAGVSPATFQALMERAGAPCERYPVFANKDDFNCFYLLKLARFHLDAWQLESAYAELGKLEAHHWADNRLYYQEWLLLHCRLQAYSGCCDHKQNYDALLDALNISHPNIDLSDFKELLLTQNEIQILTALAHEALYIGYTDICVEIHNQVNAYLEDNKFTHLEKDHLLADDATMYAKYLIYVGNYRAAYEVADKYRHKMVRYYECASLFELTFLTGLCCHYIGVSDKAALHIKAAFYSAYAVGSCYANMCRNYLRSNTDFLLTEYMDKLPELPTVQYAAAKAADISDFSDGTYNADADDIYTLGKLIHDLRTQQNLSQQVVCQGLCSKSKLSKIENGTLQPDISLIEALLQRLGLSERIFTFWGSEKEARLYELKFSIVNRHLIPNDNIQKYTTDMEPLIDKKDILWYQEYLIFKAIQNSSPTEKIDELNKAMHCTLPNFDIYRILDYRLSWCELTILNLLANTYCDTEFQDTGNIYFYHISEYLKHISPDLILKKQILPISIRAYCQTLYIEKQYKAVTELGKQYYQSPIMYYNITAYGSFLFYYCQSLCESNYKAEAVLPAICSCNINYLLDINANADILRKYLFIDFSISLEY